MYESDEEDDFSFQTFSQHFHIHVKFHELYNQYYQTASAEKESKHGDSLADSLCQIFQPNETRYLRAKESPYQDEYAQQGLERYHNNEVGASHFEIWN